MQQYGNNGRPYDQNRDSLRSSGSSQRTMPPNDGASDTSRYGFNGEPLSRPPARTANGTVRRTRTDNSIEFPTQPRPVRDTGSAARRPAGQRSTAQRPRSSGGQNRRPAQRPANRNGRPAQNSRSAARQQQQGQGYNKNQKLRPAPQRDAQRREGRKKRRLTRAAIRRRRMLRRLATFGLLLCVIGIGMYLTVTMLFRISAIQVQTADGTQVTEIAGYSADSILQTLGVQVEENIFSFDPGAKAAELERQYPLLESIRVVRDYPNTVVVQVTEATPTYAVQAGSSWLTLSDKFKILSADPAQPDGLCTLYGGEATTAAPGEQLSFAVPEAVQHPQHPRRTQQAAEEGLAQGVLGHRAGDHARQRHAEHQPAEAAGIGQLPQEAHRHTEPGPGIGPLQHRHRHHRQGEQHGDGAQHRQAVEDLGVQHPDQKQPQGVEKPFVNLVPGGHGITPFSEELGIRN